MEVGCIVKHVHQIDINRYYSTKHLGLCPVETAVVIVANVFFIASKSIKYTCICFSCALVVTYESKALLYKNILSRFGSGVMRPSAPLAGGQFRIYFLYFRRHTIRTKDNPRYIRNVSDTPGHRDAPAEN